MEPNPPRTAKEAALLGAKADKPPFNPEADRRHVIASAIRLAGEFTGQSELSADAADGVQFDAPTSSLGDGPGTSDLTSLGPAYATESPTPTYSPATSDLTLAQLVQADFVAERGLAVASSTPFDEGDVAPAGLSSSSSSQTFAQPFAPIDGDLPPVQPPGIGQSTDWEKWLDDADGTPTHQIPPLEIGPTPRPMASPPAPPHAEHPLYRLDEPRRCELLPDNLTDRKPIALGDVLMGDQPTADAAAAPVENAFPITYLPFGQPAPASYAVSPPVDKLQVEVASSFAEVNKDATLALLAFKTALLKVIDNAGEQDRIDALHREASRRACL